MPTVCLWHRPAKTEDGASRPAEMRMQLRLVPHRSITPVRYTATVLNSMNLVGLTGESSNQLFQALEEWQHHLASIDAERLRCDHDEFAP